LEEKIKNQIHIQIVTPYELFYEGSISELVVPALDGETGIWPGRTPVIIALNPGELRMTRDGEKYSIAVSSGYAEIDFNDAVVVVNAAEWPDRINTKRAQHALERSLQRLKDPGTSPRELERSKSSLMRAKARLKVAAKASKTVFDGDD